MQTALPIPREGPPPFPEDFDTHKLELLKVLLLLARGHVGAWSDIGAGVGQVGSKSLKNFVENSTSLDFHTPERLKIRAIYDDLYRFFYAKFAFKSVIASQLSQLYDDDGGLAASGWQRAEIEAEDFAAKQFPSLRKHLAGIFHVYRYSLELRGKQPMIITSAMKIFAEEGNSKFLSFWACYPTTPPSLGAQKMIIGKVIPSGQYLYFLGYDRGTQAPYSLTCNRGVVDSPIPSFFGVMLRTLRAGQISARIAALRYNDNWEEACDLVSEDPLDVFIKKNEVNHDYILQYIDNKIDGKNIFVLKGHG